MRRDITAPTQPAIQRRRLIPRWRALFPYHWDADDYVARRDFLRLLVQASGTLFAATAALVGLGYIKPRRNYAHTQAIAQVADIPRGGVHYFQYPTQEDQAILLHLQDGTFAAYSGKCTHLSCAVYHDDERKQLICPCHEGVFDPRTGEAIAGPPQRPLPRITIRQEGSTIYAVEEQHYE